MPQSPILKGIPSHSLQDARVPGCPKLLPPGCLQTKLLSHSLAHSDTTWVRDHCSPNSALSTGSQTLRWSGLEGSSGVTQETSHWKEAKGNWSHAPKVPSHCSLCFTWVLFPLKMGAPCKPRGPCPCLPIVYLSMRLDTWGTQGWNKVRTHNNSRDDDHSSSSVAFYSLSPSSCWILVVTLGGGQDRGDLKDEK